MERRDHYRTLRNQLREARASAGLTQADVAKRLNKSQSFISKVETGERQLDVIEFIELSFALNSHPVAIMSDLLNKFNE